MLEQGQPKASPGPSLDPKSDRDQQQKTGTSLKGRMGILALRQSLGSACLKPEDARGFDSNIETHQSSVR
ncbi:hypothetical protein JRQ81_007473 [Phrynocephalus forsythii]|uniref:Uncharacterized protein n=1 Tax=Phrynocephalus forsythii TaxID=171643 RepID=A0A9Q0XF87_9SAUR|nr:hypothetical protein JRQ81_007473 [Phrynocephalus forsythii]